MKSRKYDPITARFLSPDIVVQNPNFTQSYNRYSYCTNNPMKYTDPSGWMKWHIPMWAEYQEQGGLGAYFAALSNFFTSGGAFGGASGGNVSSTQLPVVVSYTMQVPVYEPTLTYFQDNNGNYNDLTLHTEDGYTNTMVSTTNWLMGYENITLQYTTNITTGLSYTTDFSNSNHALTLGGGILGALSGLTSSHGRWLGKNGKYYNSTSGRGPNQFTGSRSGAYRAANQYKFAGRATILLSVGLGIYSTVEGFQLDGGQFEYNAQYAAASCIGSIGLEIAGAKAGVAFGAAIGVWFGGFGAIPGAVLGGVIGGLGFGIGGNYLGGFLGGSAVDYYHKH